MGRIFRYEINPLYLRAVLEKMPTPDPEEAWEYFLKIHQSPKKIWKPQIKMPAIHISRIYLNGIIVSLFTLLFLYLVFFRGYSGMSEKKNEGLIKKVSIPAKENNTDYQNNKKHNKESGKSIALSIQNKSEDTMRRTTVNVMAPQDTPPNTELFKRENGRKNVIAPRDTHPNTTVNSSELLKNKFVPESEENKNLQKNTPISQITEIDTSGIKHINPVQNKRKKRKKSKKEEVEILPSLDSKEINIPSGTSNEEDVKLRGE